MKIKELKKMLSQYNEEYQIVVVVRQEDGENSVFEVKDMDDGWAPSGAISISLGEFIGG